MAEAVTLVEVQRGSLVESCHRGHVAIVDGAGHLLASAGEPDAVYYIRSSAKPFQALPLLLSGAAERFGFTEAELALACGSHGGEPRHVEAVQSMLRKAGLSAEQLQCGPHEPYDHAASHALCRAGAEPGPLHNNCSGKHAGMLAAAKHLGFTLDGYLAPEHPLQQQILGYVAQFAGLNAAEVVLGTDGCAAPTFGVPLRSLAQMFVRLVAPPAALDPAVAAAASRLAGAMMAHPEMVEGEQEDCLDTALMRAVPGRLVTKVGAEGVFAAGVLPCPAYPSGLGVAFKIEDGDGAERARSPLAVALLDDLGLLDDGARKALARFIVPEIRNHADQVVGRVRVRLPFSAPVV